MYSYTILFSNTDALNVCKIYVKTNEEESGKITLTNEMDTFVIRNVDVH